MAFDGRANIVEIDDDERIVAFDLYRKKKISGTKLGSCIRQDFSWHYRC